MQAFAKINLTLEILGRRDDGYHNLRSVMLPIGLADDLTIATADRFRFDCDPPELALDNLVVRALERLGLADARIAVGLRKRIPAGAGLGGGSSDAAAVLRAAMQGKLGAVAARDWLADARALGSDVPFFLVESGALVEGTGERVTALGALPAWWTVLVVPRVHVSTADAYMRLARERERAPAPARPRNESASMRALLAVQRGDFEGAIAAATNDFQSVVSAAYPAVHDALAALRGAGAEPALLSGSGGACFALARDERRARAIAARIVVPPGAGVYAVPLAPAAAWRTPTAPA